MNSENTCRTFIGSVINILSPSRIFDDSFCSPIFVAKYCEVEINFNIIVRFRAELKSPCLSNFYIKTKLLWADYNKDISTYRKEVI